MGDSPEESSWTFYIEGFIYDDEDDDTYCSDQPESPSLVSDAASSAVKKLGFSKQNSFKKQKPKLIPAAAILDFDLEDTASSPVNSPKQVSYINHFMNRKGKAKMDDSEVKRNSFGEAGAFPVKRILINYTGLHKEKTT